MTGEYGQTRNVGGGQAIPGLDNGLRYQGRPLTHSWAFVGDWDRCKREKTALSVR